MVKNATSPELKEALENHLEQTHDQVGLVEKVFEIIGKKATARKCEAMEGLISEGAAIMEECEEGAMRDAGIISAGQKIKHYEIASYRTLRQFAETLGLTEAASLLEATLAEEKAADQILTEVAMEAINVEAAQQESYPIAHLLNAISRIEYKEATSFNEVASLYIEFRNLGFKITLSTTIYAQLIKNGVDKIQFSLDRLMDVT